ncbi:MAG: helix-turn-helix domain-containing protein [Acetobacter persici]|uniref:IclR family transcriptional regulator n=2 Tax=Acetobacter persici TaxID=1076596 RepID=UPI001BA81B9B|nr:helix-turn-helix domain-containing protein [Acetobacter persici]
MNGSGVGVLDKYMELQKQLARVSKGLTAQELARLTSMDRGTVHRLLKAMIYWGQVEAEHGIYRLGGGCLLPASAYLTRLPLRRVALPYTIDLQNVIADRPAIVSVALPVGDQIVLIERMWTAATPFNVVADLDDKFAMDRCTSGRAILATYPEERALEILGEERYENISPRIQEIMEAGGYSFGRSEQREGLSSMGYPIRLGQEAAVGALVIAGLEMDAVLQVSSPLAQHLQRACKGISEQLFG